MIRPHRIIHEAVNRIDDTRAVVEKVLHSDMQALPVTIVSDPHMQATSAPQLPAGAVAFAISHTGRTRETYDASFEEDS